MTMRVLRSTPPLPSKTVLAAMTICLFCAGVCAVTTPQRIAPTSKRNIDLIGGNLCGKKFFTQRRKGAKAKTQRSPLETRFSPTDRRGMATGRVPVPAADQGALATGRVVSSPVDRGGTGAGRIVEPTADHCAFAAGSVKDPAAHCSARAAGRIVEPTADHCKRTADLVLSAHHEPPRAGEASLPHHDVMRARLHAFSPWRGSL